MIHILIMPKSFKQTIIKIILQSFSRSLERLSSWLQELMERPSVRHLARRVRWEGSRKWKGFRSKPQYEVVYPSSYLLFSWYRKIPALWIWTCYSSGPMGPMGSCPSIHGHPWCADGLRNFLYRSKWYQKPQAGNLKLPG